MYIRRSCLDYIHYPYFNVLNSHCIFGCACLSKIVEPNFKTNMLKNNHTATAFFCALADMALPIDKSLYARPRIYSAAYYFPVSEQKKLELEFEL